MPDQTHQPPTTPKTPIVAPRRRGSLADAGVWDATDNSKPLVHPAPHYPDPRVKPLAEELHEQQRRRAQLAAVTLQGAQQGAQQGEHRGH